MPTYSLSMLVKNASVPAEWGWPKEGTRQIDVHIAGCRDAAHAKAKAAEVYEIVRHKREPVLVEDKPK